MAAKKKTATKKRAASTMGRLGEDITKRNAWGDVTDARFQEYVAREHLEDSMPVLELHRNHGIPLSAVRRWITTYAAAGRGGLEREADASREKQKLRDAKLSARGAKPEEIAELTAKIASHDLRAMREAYAVIQKRKLRALVPAVIEAVRWADTQPDRSIQDELELLSALGAKAALHELLTSKMKIMRRYGTWFTSLLQKAGCAIRTVDKPWSQHYELDGTWYPIRVR